MYVNKRTFVDSMLHGFWYCNLGGGLLGGDVTDLSNLLLKGKWTPKKGPHFGILIYIVR